MNVRIDNYDEGYDGKEATRGGSELLLGLDFAKKVERFQHLITHKIYYIN